MIDRFKFNIARFAVAVIGLHFFCCSISADVSLHGKVVDSENKPLKDVSVFISTAAPRVGRGVL